MGKNQEVYNSPLAISTYFQRTGLTIGENAILNCLKKAGNKINMLDIGIGCGRTYEAFSGKIDKYTGIDYSEAMISACMKKFANSGDCFHIADARNLTNWTDNTFDFILFSFNGIDCVDENDRIKVFNEIKRVGKDHSLFAFSSHNMYSVPKLFKFKIPKNPFNYIPEYRRYKHVVNSNKPLNNILETGISVISDGDINKNTSYCYVKPDFQISQLESMGFEVLKVLSDQKEISFPLTSDWTQISEPWLYYLCKIKK